MGLNYCPSLPPFGFTALTLECFCNQYVELKKGVFKFKWMMLLSTRCYLSKKKKDYFTPYFNLYGTFSEKNLIFSTYIKS